MTLHRTLHIGFSLVCQFKINALWNPNHSAIPLSSKTFKISMKIFHLVLSELFSIVWNKLTSFVVFVQIHGTLRSTGRFRTLGGVLATLYEIFTSVQGESKLS